MLSVPLWVNNEILAEVNGTFQGIFTRDDPRSLQKFYQVFGPMKTRSGSSLTDTKRVYIPYIFKRNQDQQNYVHVPYFDADNTPLE